MSNSYLELKGCGRIAYVLGDCVSIKNPDTGKPFPPTAQNAIRADKVAVDNLIAEKKN